MKTAKRMQLLRVCGTLLVMAGSAALVWCGVSLARTYFFQKRSAAVLGHEMLPAKVTASLRPKPGTLLGNIGIPRVGVSSVILEGADDDVLDLSVGHIPGTAMPGESGNVALAGHRDTFFRGLRNIHKSDDILLTTSNGNQLYEVDSTRIVSPEDVDVLNDAGRPLLTLVTCYPFHYIGSAPKRFIVQAHLVGQPRVPALDALNRRPGDTQARVAVQRGVGQ